MAAKVDVTCAVECTVGKASGKELVVDIDCVLGMIVAEFDTEHTTPAFLFEFNPHVCTPTPS